MKSFFDIRSFVVLSQLCVSALAAGPLILSNSAASNLSCGLTTTNLQDLPETDPTQPLPVRDIVNGRLVPTSTSLIFKNFKSRIIPIDEKNLFAVTGKAQFDIVKSVVANHGDGAVLDWNPTWAHGKTYLVINHQIDNPLMYSVMSRAVKGVSDWAWDYASIATDFVILEDFVQVGTGSLKYGSYNAVATNVTATA